MHWNVIFWTSKKENCHSLLVLFQTEDTFTETKDDDPEPPASSAADDEDEEDAIDVVAKKSTTSSKSKKSPFSPSGLNREGEFIPAHHISVLPHLPKYSIEVSKNYSDFLGKLIRLLQSTI